MRKIRLETLRHRESENREQLIPEQEMDTHTPMQTTPQTPTPNPPPTPGNPHATIWEQLELIKRVPEQKTWK